MDHYRDFGFAALPHDPEPLLLTTATATATPRYNRPATGSETDQTTIFESVSIGRAVALPEAEQVEVADQFLKARIAAERGHLQ